MSSDANQCVNPTGYKTRPASWDAGLLALVWVLMGALFPVLAQTSEIRDSLRISSADSVTTDSLRLETSRKAGEESGVDTVVTYSAKAIDFDVRRRVTVLSGNAVITYKDMTLEAGRIEVDWDKQLLTASMLPETLFTDSTLTEIDTVIFTGQPHFTQAREDFYGEEIAYNMKSKVGRVKGGTTHYEDGYYYGQQFKRLSEDVLSVRHGEFTTCDADPPHYHFAARTLKVVVGKRVIARPVIMLFDDVPVLAAPYGIFPQQKGRTSGIIVPTFGESASQGRFLRDIGYYWAISDFMDLRASIDYFEKFGILGRGSYRYNKRYVLSGGSDFDFNTQRQGTTRRRDFALRSNHTQIVDRNTRLNMSAAYVSNESFNQNVGTVQDQLQQTVRSNATLSRSWENLPWSMSANVGYTQNIRMKTWSASLPQIQLTHKAGKLFPPPKAPRRVRGVVAPKEARPPWYRTFGWTYSVSYRNDLSMTKRPREEGLRLGLIDLSGRQRPATVIYGDDSTTVFQNDGLSHSGGINATARVLKYLNLRPSLSVRSSWSRLLNDYVPEDKLLDRVERHGLFTRTTFSLGSSATTKLYGIAQNPFGLGASVRHTMTPDVGFTYRPDFSKKSWGYYRTVSMPDGRTHTYDRWAGTIDGATPKGLSERFNFGLNHLFQMKTGEEEARIERKYDLLSINMGTAVDVRRDSLKWDNLGTSYRTQIPGRIVGPIQGLQFDVSTTHSLYAHDQDRRPIRRFFWDRDGAEWYAPLELTSASVDVGFNVNLRTVGSLFEFRVGGEAAADTTLVDSLRLLPPPAEVQDLKRFESRAGEAGKGASQFFDMPMNLSVNLRRSRDYLSRNEIATLFARMSFSLTPRWNVDFDYNLDLQRRQVNNANVQITRDLHCFDASFTWSPMGYRPGYFLRIGLKSPQLRDVKIERHRGSGLGGLR